MSLIPHGFFPRSNFDVDKFFHHTMDNFDAFDELDHLVGRDMHWLTKPAFLQPQVPKVPEKYRITVDCPGFNPKSLQIEYKNGKLYVHGREETKNDDEDYSVREFKKTYKLPDNAEVDKLASFYAGGHLVIEVPLKYVQKHVDEDLFPRIVDLIDGHKQIQMTCAVPPGIDHSKVSVTCKDRDLIIKAEDKIEKPDSMTRMYYYKRCTFPENTDFNALKCHFEDNKLKIEAPVDKSIKYHKHIPIHYKPEDAGKNPLPITHGHVHGHPIVTPTTGLKH